MLKTIVHIEIFPILQMLPTLHIPPILCHNRERGNIGKEGTFLNIQGIDRSSGESMAVSKDTVNKLIGG